MLLTRFTILVCACALSIAAQRHDNQIPQLPNSGVSVVAHAEQTANIALTVKELTRYNGKNGMPSYVAIGGFLFDATGTGLFADKRLIPGTDLSKFLVPGTPKTDSICATLSRIGTLVTVKTRTR